MSKKYYNVILSKNNNEAYVCLWNSMEKHLRTKYKCDYCTELTVGNNESTFIIKMELSKKERKNLEAFLRILEELALKDCEFKWECWEIKNCKRHFKLWF